MTGRELQVIEGTIRKKDDDEESIAGDYLTRKEITDNFVTIATDQTITGRKNICGSCLRINRSGAGCGIYLGTSNQINELTIGLSSESGAANRGLHISADGNTLTFNGSVIAGACATNGATNGSVNYSAGNPILWGVNSVGTKGGFQSDGPKIYWRAKPVTLGAVPP
ncbi:MAG: hypothetical protein EZS28_019646 [Streblomastix strix]|uniref:Uncharacterized protein n=1 Tax=Streblomastix strix TaxID=222440 RepID=A0A5J4VQ84_9EUKA|nr:MAG: hypothetical protein EZS28_019646 [Streblomastix strix]